MTSRSRHGTSLASGMITPAGWVIGDGGNGNITAIAPGGSPSLPAFKIMPSGTVSLGGQVNFQVTGGPGLISVYGTLATTGRGVPAFVGPTVSRPTDTGFVVQRAVTPTSGVSTTTGAIWGPTGSSTQWVQVNGYIDITTITTAGTLHVSFDYVDETGTHQTDAMELVPGTGIGTGSVTSTPGRYKFDGNFPHTAGSVPVACSVVVSITGAGASYTFNWMSSIQWCGTG